MKFFKSSKPPAKADAPPFKEPVWERIKAGKWGTTKDKNWWHTRNEESKYFKFDKNVITALALEPNAKSDLCQGKTEIKRDETQLNTEDWSNFKPMAMWVDGSAFIQGEHYWTIDFHSSDPRSSGNSSLAFVGVTSFTHFEKGQRGLFYSGILSEWGDVTPKVEFGPLILPGDEIGILASFQNPPPDKFDIGKTENAHGNESGSRLKLYFYHNGRCLGLAFENSSSLLFPGGIRPVVKFKLGKEEISARITKHPKLKIPPEYLRVRAPVERFGVEGVWTFKKYMKGGQVVSLKLKEEDVQKSSLEIQKSQNKIMVRLNISHFVGFWAEAVGGDKDNISLWKKTEPINLRRKGSKMDKLMEKDDKFKDFPVVEILFNPDKVELQGSEMTVIKGKESVVFERVVKNVRDTPSWEENQLCLIALANNASEKDVPSTSATINTEVAKNQDLTTTASEILKPPPLPPKPKRKPKSKSKQGSLEYSTLPPFRPPDPQNEFKPLPPKPKKGKKRIRFSSL